LIKKYWLLIILIITILISNLTFSGCTQQKKMAEGRVEIHARSYTEGIGGDIIKCIRSTITTSEQITKNVFIDIFNESVQFTLAGQVGDLNLTLKRPDGTIVNPELAETDHNIGYVEEDSRKFYMIFENIVGEWQVVIDAVDVTGKESFILVVSGLSMGVLFNVYTGAEQYTYPENILIQAEVVAEYNVANAEVTGTVEMPDGRIEDITLYDDGLESHGDEFQDDGFYSNYFSDYVEEGTYTFDMVVNNKEGIEASGQYETFPEGWTPQPISPFTREAFLYIEVEKVVITYTNPLEYLIAFVSSRDGNQEIYTMDSNGNNQLQLTDNDLYKNSPLWSPDGKKIAFEAQAKNGDYDIYIMDSDGNNLKKLTDNSDYSKNLSWSPDGKKIVFVLSFQNNYPDSEIYVIDSDGNNQIQLTNNDLADGSPCWSLDGKKIAFVSSHDGDYEIYTMDPDGENQIQLTNNDLDDFNLYRSPDGKRIVFVSNRDGDQEIYAIDSDGNNQIKLTDNNSADVSPCWSPDGKKIAFVSDRDGDFEIYIMNPGGENQIQLTNNDSYDGDFSWSSDH